MSNKEKDNICPECGVGYIITSIGFKKICKCSDPIKYDLLETMFGMAFEEKGECKNE